MEKLQFHIQSLDHFGQGVHKDGKRIVFIPKTLPGESGVAEVISQKKGVEFARAIQISNSSPQRIEPECPHFEKCQACAYLHTSYEQEVAFKEESLQNQLKPLAKEGQKLPPLSVLPSPHRFGYRNRIQLHFDKKTRQLGLLKARQKNKYDILPIPQCLLPQPSLREALQSLYNSPWWERPELKEVNRGVIILKQLASGDIQLAVNADYAAGAFEQVHEQMNEKALALIHDFIERKVPHQSETLDLFGGRGNLSASKKLGETWVIDQPAQLKTRAPHQKYLACNLFKVSSKELRQQLPSEFSPELLIVDPPRSGFKQMNEFVEEWKPQHVVLMSCQSSTLVRDLRPLKNYAVQNIYLLDFFPGTFHYESLVFLSRKSENPQISGT